jgi:hypothetical protein
MEIVGNETEYLLDLICYFSLHFSFLHFSPVSFSLNYEIKETLYYKIKSRALSI